MAKKTSKPMNKGDETKLFAFLGVFLTIIGFIIVYATRKQDKYAMYYAKQGLVLFIAYIIAWAIVIVPVIGWLLSVPLYIFLLILWIIGIIYSLSGEQKPIPLIGEFADKINL